MTVFALIPVFNRLSHTRRVIDALRAQTAASTIRIIVIDDGSTDDTGEYLKAQRDVQVLTGGGDLWWGGAIELGLRHVLERANDEDYVLFLNNDTWFQPEYVETLVRLSRGNGGAAVGSVVHEEGRDIPLAKVGPRLDLNQLRVWDIVSELSRAEMQHPQSIYKVDALSGRGTIFPASLFRRYGRMRPILLPHYLADYELSMRFARYGVPLLISTEAVVYSPPVYGSEMSGLSRWSRMFSQRSATNVFRLAIFFMLVGTPWQRVTAPARMAWKVVRKAISRRVRSTQNPI